MAYYCGKCGAKLKTQLVKSGSEETRSGTTKVIHHKVLFVKTITRYICPNGCELNLVRQS